MGPPPSAPGLGECATHQGDLGEGRERGLDGQSPDRSGSTGGMLGMMIPGWIIGKKKM